jgi:hypothetical protein
VARLGGGPTHECRVPQIGRAGEPPDEDFDEVVLGPTAQHLVLLGFGEKVRT